jgi:radical SAM protein with 4Fe4S-binding SPASM domain
VVDLTGGEPLLRPDWHTLAKEIFGMGMRVSVITNGILLDERAMDKAEEARVERLGISIDGLQETHNAIRRRRRPGPSPFDKTVAALERAVSRFPVHAITAVNRHNLGELLELGHMLHGIGITRWQLQLTIPTRKVFALEDALVNNPEELEGLAAFIAESRSDEQMPFIDTSDNIGYYTEWELPLRQRNSGQGVWLGCQAGIRAVAITYEGKVRGCSVLPPEFDCGDLHQEPLEEVWRDKRRFRFATMFDPRRLEGDCTGCQFGALCRAGCTSMAYWTTGSIYQNPYCLLGQRERKKKKAQRNALDRECKKAKVAP